MHGPMSVVDTLYAQGFPTYDKVEHWLVDVLPASRPELPTLMWWAEYGANTHAHLKRIFESRMDPTVVLEVGKAINERGGMQALQASFYIYCHLIGQRLEDMKVTQYQWCELHTEHAKKLTYLWDGIGDWRA